MHSCDMLHGLTGTAGRRLGLEMEMVVADARTGASARVDRYFDALRRIKAERQVSGTPVFLEGRCVAIRTESAECGLDNGFNLLETALMPVTGGTGGLGRLAERANQELSDTLRALSEDGLTVLNSAQHPACARDQHFYEQTCVPRPIYRELIDYRGWVHREGIDAKAQNGANTAVPVGRATQALNVVIGLAAANIAIFANSPLEAGQITGLKENRMTLWPRVFGPARFPGDLELQRFPRQPFRDLAHYFHWMFGTGTVSRSLPLTSGDDYKVAATAVLDGDPCLLDFLQSDGQGGRRLDDGRSVLLRPHASHFVHSQIAVFLDARFRYRLEHMPSLQSLLAAWQQEGGLEALFAECGIDGYIEGRAPGANFADKRLVAEAGHAAAQSVLVAPSALQLGLLNNVSEALLLIQDWGWVELGQIRDAAIRQGMEDARIRALCADVLDVARRGLPEDDHHWLNYADYVIRSGRSGADRLLGTWRDRNAGGIGMRLAHVVDQHTAIVP